MSSLCSHDRHLFMDGARSGEQQRSRPVGRYLVTGHYSDRDCRKEAAKLQNDTECVRSRLFLPTCTVRGGLLPKTVLESVCSLYSADSIHPSSRHQLSRTLFQWSSNFADFLKLALKRDPRLRQSADQLLTVCCCCFTFTCKNDSTAIF